MARKTVTALLAEMDAKFTAFAREAGDRIQAIEDNGDTGGTTSGLRRVSPPSNDQSPGAVGDVATDGDYAYFYIGNGTNHKWGQALLITEFTR
jgi:hypothetical protein